MYKCAIYCFLFCFANLLPAQDDSLSIDDLLNFGDEETTNYAKASFKTNRVINLHSLENTSPGVMDLKISHRFGTVNQGLYDIFGLDVAQMRIGYDLGLTDRLVIGGGRSNFQKVFDGYVKYKLLRQQSGKRNVPVTAAVIAGMGLRTDKFEDPDRINYFWARAYYNFHLLLGRKFSESFSLQLTPSMIHRNLTKTELDKNDVYALGIGVRQKLNRRVAINVEYIYVFPDQMVTEYVNSLSVGFDIETGGHVFQLHFTNSQGMNEKAFITETISDWRDFQFHFGFNLSRVFTLWNPKQK